MVNRLVLFFISCVVAVFSLLPVFSDEAADFGVHP